MNSVFHFFSKTTHCLLAVTILLFVLCQWVSMPFGDSFKLFHFSHADFAWWQLASYLFLHASWPHLLFNMFALFLFGSPLEKIWGKRRFLVFYFICGVGAAIVHLSVLSFQLSQHIEQLVSLGVPMQTIEHFLQTGLNIGSFYPQVEASFLVKTYTLYHAPTVGASGAIYGVLVAFALMFPNFKLLLIFLPIPIKAKYFVPILLVIDLASGVTGFSLFAQNIAHFAHLGGALFGFLLVKFARFGYRNRYID